MLFPPGFDNSIALEAAALVMQAYDQYDHFKNHQPWSLTGNYDRIASLEAIPPGILGGILDHVEPFGFVAQNRSSGSVFVTFRGTQSPGDWMANLSFPQVPHSWGATEQGFTKLYGQCSHAVIKAVRDTAGAASLYVTGHSLGGALSTLATADIVINGFRAVLYNFASPRTGDRNFAAKFNANVPAAWRVVNSEDIVTTVPLATIKISDGPEHMGALKPLLALSNHLDYEHVGTPVTFTQHNGSIIGNHRMPTYTASLA